MYEKGFREGLIGQVTIGNKQQPICIPGNATITITGCTSKLPSRITCLVEQVEHHNLLLGIVINRWYRWYRGYRKVIAPAKLYGRYLWVIVQECMI